MSRWLELISRFPPERRAAVEFVLRALEFTGVEDATALARLNEDVIAAAIEALTGDNPFTDLDDMARRQFATKLLAHAREVGRRPRPSARRPGERILPAKKAHRSAPAPSRARTRDRALVPAALPLADLAKAGLVRPELTRRLSDAALTEVTDLLRPQGMAAVQRLRLGRTDHVRLLAAAKFAAATDDIALAARAVDKGLTSLSAVALLPQRRLERLLEARSPAERTAVRRLRTIAKRARTNAVHSGIQKQRKKSADGGWLSDIGAEEAEQTDKCADCGCCDNVFSPRAYVSDLLDFIYYHWQIPAKDLEKILCQDILDLTCAVGTSVMPQARIGVSVLERYLGAERIPLKSAALAQLFEQELGWVRDYTKKIDTLFTPVGRDAAAQKLVAPAASLTLVEWIETDFSARVAPHSRNAFEARLAKSVAAFLSGYRGLLIDATNEDVKSLERKLFIELQSGLCQSTTPITQLIQSLRAFVLAIRTGMILEISRTDLDPGILVPEYLAAEPVEEAAWQWLGSYDTWTAAVYALVFTENVLPPPINVPAFEALATEMLASPGAQRVRELYSAYAVPLPFFDGSTLEDWDLSSATMRELDWLLMRGEYARETRPLSNFVEGLDAARATINYATANESVPNGMLDPLDEIEQHLLFPLLAGWTLNRSGEYAAANDWYRRLYDPFRPAGQRHVFDFNGHFQDQEIDSDERIKGPLDVLGIARRRKGVYLRHSVLMMVKNLLEWADHEYTRATTESVATARELYQLAAIVLQAPDLGGDCFRAIRKLELDIVEEIVVGLLPVEAGIRQSVARLYSMHSRTGVTGAVGSIRAVLTSDGPPLQKLQRTEAIVSSALENDSKAFAAVPLGTELDRRRATVEGFENQLFARPQKSRDWIDGGGTDGRGGTDGLGAGPGRWGREPDLNPDKGDYVDGFRDHPVDPHEGVPEESDEFPTEFEEVDEPVSTSITFCIPGNPLLKSFRDHIDINLAKLNSCLSIIGERLPSRPFICGSAPDRLGALTDQQMNVDQFMMSAEPPRYRYTFLVEKARQYVDLAQRLEGALIQALEKGDNEAYQRLLAEQTLELAGATVSLKQLGVRDALLGRDVAGLQVGRADTQKTFWENRLANGWVSQREKDGLNLMLASAALQLGAAGVYGAMALPAVVAAGAGGITAGAGGVATFAGGVTTALTFETGAGAVAGAAMMVAGGVAGSAGIAGAGAGMLLGGGQNLAGGLQAAAGAAATLANWNLTTAGFERRREEWQLQRSLSRIDSEIAGVQLRAAQNRVGIAHQEQRIAELQRTNAEVVLRFLKQKFGSTEFYEWMRDVLLQQYHTVMQIATATAQLAERALQFERQEPSQLILGDYWSVDMAGARTAHLSNAQKSAGILGAERLLTDIAKMDAYKLVTDKRQFQLSKAISMARMLPAELVELREKGAVTFNTLLDWFDRDFPGHYLRLIKSVRVTVVAMIPPLDGIHAMLSNGGESSVVVRRGDEFEVRRSMRSHGEAIALDAPYNDTGLFVLDYNDPMFLPFEGLGVETQWLFELRRATNRFNRNTIADVIFTIEYTASYSADYRAEVETKLGTTGAADLVLDARMSYPDLWYHVKNPSTRATGSTLRLDVPAAILPPHFVPDTPRKVTHATLVVVGELADYLGTLRGAMTMSRDGLTLTTAVTATAGQVAFANMQPNGTYLLFSTRREGDTQPTPLAGSVDVVGPWTISLDSALYTTLDASGKPLIDRVQDVIVMLSVEGQVDWGA